MRARPAPHMPIFDGTPPLRGGPKLHTSVGYRLKKIIMFPRWRDSSSSLTPLYRDSGEQGRQAGVGASSALQTSANPSIGPLALPQDRPSQTPHTAATGPRSMAWHFSQRGTHSITLLDFYTFSA